MQKRVCKIVLLVLCATVFAQAHPIDVPAGAAQTSPLLQKGDSLFAAKQYTQAFEHYRELHAGGRYSPTMFLKMAYIQEGLGHLGESLYYLNLYFLASDDTQALKKMEELAEKNQLEGYQANESVKFRAWVLEHYRQIAWVLASAAIFFVVLMTYQRTRLKMNPSLAGIGLVIMLAALFVHINYSAQSERAIVFEPQTFLMSGPSSASSVIAIIGEGHQLKIEGKKDVWLRVSWKDREVYVKENLVRAVRL
jgi:hypothetical protein